LSVRLLEVDEPTAKAAILGLPQELAPGVTPILVCESCHLDLLLPWCAHPERRARSGTFSGWVSGSSLGRPGRGSTGS